MIEVREGGLDHPAVAALLGLHLAAMHDQSPAGSVHALDRSALAAPEIAFFTAWDGAHLLGCGALKALGPDHGEVKSMRTAPGHLRRGVAAALLDRIVEAATARGYTRLSLETGSGDAFAAAHLFYLRHGFTPCPAFGDYPADDPFSRFMSRKL